MEYLTKYLESSLQNNLQGIIILFVIFVASNFIFYHLAKIKKQRLVMYQVLKLIQNTLAQKLGSKGEALIVIWTDGLAKIQDGEFSQEDCLDQFLRYIRLAASQNGINLTDVDIELLHTIILSTMDIFITQKPQDISNVVNKFTVQNLR